MSRLFFVFFQKNRAPHILNGKILNGKTDRIMQHDITCLQETHALQGKTVAFRLPEGYCAVWANGSSRQGGVGIILKHAFLRLFDTVNPLDDLEVVEGGRVATLHLHGPYGNLDICCAYLDATSSAARRRSLHKLGRVVKPKSTTLTILAGDFNFVVDRHDRWSEQSGLWSDNGDKGDQ